MPISGLMVTLTSDAETSDAALRAMRDFDAIELGVRNGRRVAAVLDTPTDEHNRRAWRWLNDLDGVSLVDVLFVSFDEDANEPTAERATTCEDESRCGCSATPEEVAP